MDPSALALIELLLVFGSVAAFCLWQLRELNQRARARAEAARLAEMQAPDDGQGKAGEGAEGTPATQSAPPTSRERPSPSPSRSPSP